MADFNIDSKPIYHCDKCDACNVGFKKTHKALREVQRLRLGPLHRDPQMRSGLRVLRLSGRSLGVQIFKKDSQLQAHDARHVLRPDG